MVHELAATAETPFVPSSGRDLTIGNYIQPQSITRLHPHLKVFYETGLTLRGPTAPGYNPPRRVGGSREGKRNG